MKKYNLTMLLCALSLTAFGYTIEKTAAAVEAQTTRDSRTTNLIIQNRTKGATLSTNIQNFPNLKAVIINGAGMDLSALSSKIKRVVCNSCTGIPETAEVLSIEQWEHKPEGQRYL